MCVCHASPFTQICFPEMSSVSIGGSYERRTWCVQALILFTLGINSQGPVLHHGCNLLLISDSLHRHIFPNFDVSLYSTASPSSSAVRFELALWAVPPRTIYWNSESYIRLWDYQTWTMARLARRIHCTRWYTWFLLYLPLFWTSRDYFAIIGGEITGQYNCH